MNIILCRYYLLLIYRLCYHYFLYYHPSDCNIVTQYSHQKTVSFEHITFCLVPRNHTCTFPPTITEAPPRHILSVHPSLQPFYCNIHISEHCNHHRLTPFGPCTYKSFIPCPCNFPLQSFSSELYPHSRQVYFLSVPLYMASLCQCRPVSCQWRGN